MGEEEKEEKFKCFLREEVRYFLRSGDTIWSFIIQVSNLNHQPTNHSADDTRPVLHVRDFSGARPLAAGPWEPLWKTCSLCAASTLDALSSSSSSSSSTAIDACINDTLSSLASISKLRHRDFNGGGRKKHLLKVFT